MDLREVFSNYEAASPSGGSNVQSTSLALRRGGINTMEQLRKLSEEEPERVTSLRGIGPRRMALIREILDFWAPPV